ncbi:hypothetical protein HAX54_051414, partial [Datura stramonium]|nr:hypothetical protein [Datura stramonium]
MEKYNIDFKEKRVIHAKAQFDAESFKAACLDIYNQIGTRDWGPFTIPVDLYFPELVWEFYASYIARQQLLKYKGRTETLLCLTSCDLKFEARMWLDLVCARLIPSRNTSKVPIEVSILPSCIMDHLHINVGEIIVDRFKCKAMQQATTLPFPNLVSTLCMRAACPFFRPLDRTVQADSVITLATKTDKDAPVMKRGKYTGNRTPPPPSPSTHTSVSPFHTTELHNTTSADFLNIAQRDKKCESQFVRLAKAIPSMIQHSIKKALQPAKDKLASLCSTVEVLESEVGTLRKEVVALSAPPSTDHPTPCEPAMMPAQPKAPRSPPDDWWVGYD